MLEYAIELMDGTYLICINEKEKNYSLEELQGLEENVLEEIELYLGI